MAHKKSKDETPVKVKVLNDGKRVVSVSGFHLIPTKITLLPVELWDILDGCSDLKVVK